MTMAKLCECGCGKPAPIATKTQASSGAVKGQPVRFVRGHAASLAAAAGRHAYWIEEDGPLSTPCRVWQGAVNSKGYPSRLNPASGKPESGHRMALEESLGRRLRAGHQAHHVCQNTRCVNGDHLEEVTRVEHNARHRKLAWA